MRLRRSCGLSWLGWLLAAGAATPTRLVSAGNRIPLAGRAVQRRLEARVTAAAAQAAVAQVRPARLAAAGQAMVVAAWAAPAQASPTRSRPTPSSPRGDLPARGEAAPADNQVRAGRAARGASLGAAVRMERVAAHPMPPALTLRRMSRRPRTWRFRIWRPSRTCRSSRTPRQRFGRSDSRRIVRRQLSEVVRKPMATTAQVKTA